MKAENTYLTVRARIVAGAAPPKAQRICFGDRELQCVTSVRPDAVQLLLFVPHGSELLEADDE